MIDSFETTTADFLGALAGVNNFGETSFSHWPRLDHAGIMVAAAQASRHLSSYDREMFARKLMQEISANRVTTEGLNRVFRHFHLWVLESPEALPPAFEDATDGEATFGFFLEMSAEMDANFIRSQAMNDSNSDIPDGEFKHFLKCLRTIEEHHPNCTEFSESATKYLLGLLDGRQTTQAA